MDSLKTAQRRALLVAVCLLAMGQQAHAVNGSCSFQVKGTMTLAFPSIDPSSASNAVASVMPGTLTRVGDCRVPMLVSADGGQNFSGGSRRMSNGGTDFIPYSLTAAPPATNPPGNNRWSDVVITGTIAPADFQNAKAGSYSDLVIITVTP